MLIFVFLHVLLKVFCFFVCNFGYFCKFSRIWAFFAHILCPNFSDSKFCVWYFVSFFHLCPGVTINIVPYCCSPTQCILIKSLIVMSYGICIFKRHKKIEKFRKMLELSVCCTKLWLLPGALDSYWRRDDNRTGQSCHWSAGGMWIHAVNSLFGLAT